MCYSGSCIYESKYYGPGQGECRKPEGKRCPQDDVPCKVCGNLFDGDKLESVLCQTCLELYNECEECGDEIDEDLLKQGSVLCFVCLFPGNGYNSKDYEKG